jgi:Carboxypeptidase regulatory-like domain/TonB dependent receptor
MPSSTFPSTRWLVVVLCLVSSILVLAQGTGGRILGRVADSTGAVLANVRVTLVNEGTGVSQETLTNSTGDYGFPQVAVGAYRLEFDLAGFKKDVQHGISVDLNQVLTVNMIMQVGQTKETVEVTSEAPLVDTTSTQLGAVVDDRAVSQLPLNARDTYQLLQLQPGVQSQLGNPLIYGSDKAGAVSVNGGRGRSNNFSVNGGDANDAFVNLPTVQPTPDSIQEFRVLTNTFDAEYGRNSGSVVNVVTKSGTNALHGDVYEFFRNKVLNARNYFEQTRPQFQQNQFGGTLGGPIKKDRTFFFTSYEGRRVRQPTTFPVVTPPSQAERSGDFSAGGGFTGSIGDPFFASVLAGRPGCSQAIANEGGVQPVAGLSYTSVFPNSQVPIACMDPVAVNLMNLYVPLPNRPDGTYQATVIGPARADQMTAKVDHRINDHQNLSVYYYFNDDRTVQPFAFFQFAGATVPNFGSIVAERIQQWNVSHTWTVSQNSVNEFRFTYMREAQRTFQHPQKTNLVVDSCNGAASAFCFTGTSDSSAVISAVGTSPKLGITPNLGPDHEGVPFVNIAGGVNFGNNSEGDIPQVGNSFQWSDSFTRVAGKHTFKFGVDLRRQRFDQELFFEVSGGFTYTGGGSNANDPLGSDLYGNYFLGLPDTFGQGSAQKENVRSTGLYLFAQDSWKIKPNLTLNYGLRWELDTPLVDIGHRVQTFRPGQQDTIFPCQIGPNGAPVLGVPPGTSCDPGGPAASVYPLGLVIPGDKGVPDGLTKTYYKSFAPRIGLAWSPGSSGKTSIRAGWGMFYNPIEQLVLEQFSAEPPFGGSSFFSGTLFNTPYVSQSGAVTPNPFNGVLNPPRGQPVDWSVFRPILLFGQFPPAMRTQYSAQYNFGIQRQLRPDLVLQVNYVGSQGHRLLAIHDVNYANPQTCLDLITLSTINPASVTDGNGNPASCGPFGEDVRYVVQPGAIPAGMTFHLPTGQNIAGGANSPGLTIVGTRRYSSPECNYINPATCPPDGTPVFSEIYAEDPVANSNYNSLQASLEKRFAKSLQFQLAYTFSKSIDQASTFENILDPVNFRRTRSLSLFDARHRFVLSYFWEFPVPKYSGAKGKILDGWAMSGITTYQSGFPIRITSFSDSELFGDTFSFEFPSEPDQVLPFRHLDPRKNGGFYFDPNTFTDATVPVGQLGNAPRTICCGPGIQDWTIAFHKNTPITEGSHIEFRAEFFNAFNHTQFLNPCGNTSGCNDGSTYGKVSQARNGRLIQLALKYIF